MPDPPDLRASDAERERAVARLRRAAAEGRLTVEELGERCERAYAARTHAELSTLLADLPGGATVVAVPPRAPAPVDPGGMGRRPFTYVFSLPAAPDAAMDAALRTMAPALGRGGYELVARGARRLEFDSRRTPAAAPGSSPPGARRVGCGARSPSSASPSPPRPPGAPGSSRPAGP